MTYAEKHLNPAFNEQFYIFTSRYAELMNKIMQASQSLKNKRAREYLESGVGYYG